MSFDSKPSMMNQAESPEPPETKEPMENPEEPGAETATVSLEMIGAAKAGARVSFVVVSRNDEDGTATIKAAGPMGGGGGIRGATRSFDDTGMGT